MSWTVTFYDTDVESEILDLPTGLLARFVRYAERMEEHGPDLGMPHIDGRQVAQSVKAEAPWTPIIMLTGWGTMLKEEGNIPPQVDAVVTKPPKLADLLEALAKVTEKQAAA